MTDQAPVKLTDRSAQSITRSLREFGYPVSVEEVRDTGNKLLAGGSPDSDIIAMFIRGMLEDAGLLNREARA